MRLSPNAALLTCLPLLAACGTHRERVEGRWTAPPGAWDGRYAGMELVGLDRWGGYGINARVGEQFIELRCAHQPRRRIRRAYWPGPEWVGTAEWTGAGVTYRLPKGWRSSGLYPLTFSSAEVGRLGRCPVSR